MSIIVGSNSYSSSGPSKIMETSSTRPTTMSRNATYCIFSTGAPNCSAIAIIETVPLVNSQICYSI
jgi:hypothetical protein